MLRKMVTALALMLASPAMAQTVLAPPSVKWAGQFTVPTPVQNIGYDSGTGLPCIVGSVATCAVPTSGATGGGAVYGPTAKGSPAANPPVVMGGTADGTATGNVTVAKVDTSGNLSVSAPTQAPVTAATATATASSLIGCQYQTTPDTFTNGQQGHVACGPKGSVVVSSAIANGSPPVHSPVLTAGWDNTNTQTFLTDTSGREIVVGAAAAGSAIAGNPVLVAGSDGTNARTLSVTASGTLATNSTATGNVASGGSDTGNPVKTGCVNNTTLPTVTTGQRVDCQADVRGGQLVVLKTGGGTAQSTIVSPTTGQATTPGLVVNAQGVLFNSSTNDQQRSIQGIDGTGLGVSAVEEGGASFNNITTATTTTVKSGAGTLHKLCINTYVASGTITIYNNTAASGTKIATITNPATLLAEGPNCAVFDVYFSTGLTIVTTGAQDITAIYR